MYPSRKVVAFGAFVALLFDWRPMTSKRASGLRFFAVLALVAAGPPLLWSIAYIVFGGPSFNDYSDYWLAGKLVLQGHSPYDTAALAALAKTEGVTFLLGGGYQYLLPWAIAMAPFASQATRPRLSRSA